MEIFLEGHKSEKFQLNRGVHQGCPSPLIFDLVIEVLAAMVRQQQRIKGVESLIRKHKLLLYTDDIVFTLQNPVSNIIDIEQIIGGLWRGHGIQDK